MGARGQLGRDPLADRPRRRRGAARVRRPRPGALRSASDAAYRAVRKPVEGTMLTAIRELAEEAERGSGLAAIVARGDDCVARTQRMLPVLTEAGVVDAGRGRPGRDRARNRRRARRRAAAGAPRRRGVAARRSTPSTRSSRATATARSSSSRASALDADALEAELEPLGDSLLVVGDPSALKVHVHTDDPGRALSLGVARGTRSQASRSRTCTPRRASARSGCCTPVPAVRGARDRARRRCAAAPATGGCSRASARASSTAAGR